MGRRPEPPLPDRFSRCRATSPMLLEYAARCDDLSDGFRDTATAAALQTIVDLELDSLTTVEPPRGDDRD